jgi:multidrug efflux pump subunit AcrB
MNFSALSIKSPIPAILLFILLSLAGALSFRATNVQDFPDIELPVVTVSATLSGASPSQLETEVARKLENSIATLSQIKNINTRILEGDVLISVEFELEKNASDAENEVRSTVAQVRADLPADVKDPIVSKVNTSGRPIVTYVVNNKGNLSETAVSWLVDDAIAKKILSVKGVGKFQRIGGVTREVQITLDPLKMASLNVSALTVSRQLKRVQNETPGGRGDVGGIEQSVRTIATLKSAEELALLELPLPDGRKIRLDQVATISDTIAERRSMALYNGKPIVAFEITRTKGASELVVGAAVAQAVAELNQTNPLIEIQPAFDNIAPVQENFDGSMHLLYEGAVLAVLVVWWFLRDWRATFVAAVALPLSILPTFIGMQYFGFTLNTVTLLSLALVVGILVDDAIVEIENISRHLRMGKTPLQAALEAADEIGMAVIATTFALVAVFLPTAFMAGVPGKFFKQFGWTAVLAIMASLLVARLITPMMAAYIMRRPQHEEHDGWIMQRYLLAMEWCLRHRHVTIFAAVAFCIGSLMLVPLLPKGFIPAADRAQTMVSIELPPGSTLDETLAMAEQARQIVKQHPTVQNVFSSVGGGVSGDAFAKGSAGEARKANLTVLLSHRNDRKQSIAEVEADFRRQLAVLSGVRLSLGQQGNGVKMQLALQSDDAAALTTTAQAVERELRTLSGIGNVSSSASLVRPEIIITPDFAKAADLGVTAADIGETIRVATAGDYDSVLAKLNLPQRQIPIRVKLDSTVRMDMDALARLTVPSKRNGNNSTVMLGQVATLTMDSSPAQINRLKRMRNVALEVELGQRELGDVYAAALALPTMKNLPYNVTLVKTGDTEVMAELFASFGLAMGIGVLCIYMVLVLLFKDFMQPITILMALPLSMGGAFVLLLLANKSFSMPSLIGLLMLMGVVTKNSILLVEYAIEARRGMMNQPPMSRFDALVDACHKRARPIVMTSLAMGAGMLPIALGFGSDPSFRSPMATAVLGGLVTSTLLSLLVIPAAFTYVDDVQQFLRRITGRSQASLPPQS